MDYAQIITAAIALLAVLVGPFVMLHIARRQVRSNVVSANRQAWINSLRDEISSFVAQLQISSFSLLNQPTFNAKDAKEATRHLLRIEAKIRLLINPKEDDHASLVRSLHEALLVASSPKTKGESDEEAAMKVRERIDSVIELSQSILKREWERVKSGG